MALHGRAQGKAVLPLGLKGIAPHFRTTRPSRHPYGKYPYLLRDRFVRFPNEVWATDITYVKTPWGMKYYTAIIDWRSRKLLSWRISDSMDASFCLNALHEAVMLYGARPFSTPARPASLGKVRWKATG